MLNRRLVAATFLGLALQGFASQALAVDVQFKPVAEGVYVHVGDLGPRTAANEGLNANVGFVETDTGVIVIDPGATHQSARDIHRAIQAITKKPVRWVINTGGQDHRWLGNGYFQGLGAEVLAHDAARADMQQRGGDHLAALAAVLGPARMQGTTPSLPTRWVQGSDVALTLDGTRLELMHRGGAHTPGDWMVWLPQKQVMFAGDVVYMDRLLSVIPASNTQRWVASLQALAQRQPRTVVPGHGRVTDVAGTQRESLAYLLALRAHMKKAVDAGDDVSAAARAFDGRPFAHLLNASDLMPGNASRTYLEIERE